MVPEWGKEAKLHPFEVVMKVFIQNQVGHKPRRWDKTGVIVECKDFDQYVVKVDGTGRLTLRNRKFLRKLMPIQKKTVQDARKTVLKPALLPASPRPAQHHPVTQNRDYAELPLGYQQGAGQPQDHLQPIQHHLQHTGPPPTEQPPDSHHGGQDASDPPTSSTMQHTHTP